MGVHGGTTLLEDTRRRDVRPRPIPPNSAWSGRPALAFLLRSLIFLAPIAASTAVTFGVARLWRRPAWFWPAIGWWLVMLLIGSLTMLAVDRLARRFLPLSTLLRMTLIFPDQAPSRFGVALRSGTTRQLRDRLAAVQFEHASPAENGREGTTEGAAAERLLELAIALRQHDRFTRGHGERVRAYSALIGEELDLDPIEISKLQWAGLIHDVGKLAVPSEILNKPGRLTDEEFEVIKTHPAAGMVLAGPLSGWLGEWVQAVGQHHERWDGGGYPNGLAGHEIALAGRIVAVADAFDVMTAVRSYKPPHSAKYAREELARHAGSQFDPGVVRAFMSVSIGRLRAIMWPLSWLADVPLLGPAVMSSAARVAAPVLLASSSVVAGGTLAHAFADPSPEPAPAVDQIVPSVTSAGTTNPAMVPQSSVERAPGQAPASDAPGSSRAPSALDATLPPNPTPNPTPTTTPIAPSTTPADDVTGTSLAAPTAATPTASTSAGQPAPGQASVTVVTSPSVATTAVPVTTAAPATTVAPATTLATTTTTAALTPCQLLRGGATDLADATLLGCDLSNLRLDGVNLAGADLTGANLAGIALSNFNLDGATLAGADLTGARLNDGSLKSVDARSLDAQRVTITRVDLASSNYSGSDFASAVLTDVSFGFADLTDADFTRATMTGTNFNDAVVARAVFDQALMSSTELFRASAPNASFNLADVRWSRFDDADLTRATLATALLAGATLDRTNLDGADLSGATLLAATGTPSSPGSAVYLLTVCPNGLVRSSPCWA